MRYHFYPRSPCGERQTQTQKTPHFTSYFYPRSPCGERQGPAVKGYRRSSISIHALLAESDVCVIIVNVLVWHFYPRSPCGERLCSLLFFILKIYFYPRSPCGERLCILCSMIYKNVISIHALLAESDGPGPARLASRFNFYPRSPCGERQPLWQAR